MLLEESTLRLLILDAVDPQGDAWKIGNAADVIPVQMRDQRKVQVVRLQRPLLKMLSKRLLEGEVCQCFAEEQRLIDEKKRDIGAEPGIVEKRRFGMLDQHRAMCNSTRSKRESATYGNKLRNSDAAAAQEGHVDIRQCRGIQRFPFFIRAVEQKMPGQRAFNSNCRS